VNGEKRRGEDENPPPLKLRRTKGRGGVGETRKFLLFLYLVNVPLRRCAVALI